jgi:hypothetical protein
MLFENTPDITSENRVPVEVRQARLDYLARCYATCTPHEASPFDENGLYMRKSDQALFGPRSKWDFFSVDELEFVDPTAEGAVDFEDYLNS